MSSETVYIYGLKDPRNGRIKYVGRTTNPSNRLNTHISDAYVTGWKNSPKNTWIRRLNKAGLDPKMVILEACSRDACELAEADWIQKCANKGKLFNIAAADRYGVHKGTFVGLYVEMSPELRADCARVARKAGKGTEEWVTTVLADCVSRCKKLQTSC